MKTTQSNSWLGAGLVTALAASLCCITPVLALLGGISGIAASFSWLEPLRPYLIGSTVLVLGFAWYQKLKPAPADAMDCACETDEKPPFLQSKKFLGIVTALALVMLTFPYYSAAFFPAQEGASQDRANQEGGMTLVPAAQTGQAKLFVKGMTCSGCELSVNHALTQKPGVLKATSSHQEGIALVTFDQRKVTPQELARAVTQETGYKVTGHQLIQPTN